VAELAWPELAELAVVEVIPLNSSRNGAISWY